MRDRLTAQAVRDIGHARWEDPLAALENPHSAEFKEAVAVEDATWSRAVKQVSPSILGAWRRDFTHFQRAAWPEARRWAHANFVWCERKVSIQPAGAGYTYNLWIDDWRPEEPLSHMGFGGDGWFFTMADVGQGGEDLELTVWRFGKGKDKAIKQWTRPHVGPSVVIRADRIYFSTVENRLRYPDVWSAELQTGEKATRLFHEPDPRFQVSFEARGHDNTIFIHTANALTQRLGVLDAAAERVRWITEYEDSTLVPVTTGVYARNEEIVFTNKQVAIPLPAGHYIEDAAEAPFKGAMFVTTVKRGRACLWLLRDVWHLLWDSGPVVGEVEIIHEPTTWPTFRTRCPTEPDTLWEFRGGAKDGVWSLQRHLQYPEPLKLHVVATDEGTGVPYTVVSHVKSPKKLLVEAYGAYGISARRAYPVRWLPWLKRGYAFAYVCPRGGREGGDAWWDAARGAVRKHRTFEDTAAAIANIQTRIGVAPTATVFFGRSAGGWLAAAIAQQHGHLVAAVYAEVPYVDILRTTTNPHLPLTQMEYDEFGDPVRRVEEWHALKKISPVDTVPRVSGHPEMPKPVLVIRTALHDSQVLPYEALKWSHRLREAGWPAVFVGIDHDGGHFAAATSMEAQRAEDAALLDAAT